MVFPRIAINESSPPNDSAIFDDNKDQALEPIVQCVQIKPLPPQPGHQERYRAVFSDIANDVQTMLASRMWIDLADSSLTLDAD